MSGGLAKKGKESERKNAVNAYVKSLKEMWSKAFGSENIMETKSEMYWHCISRKC